MLCTDGSEEAVENCRENVRRNASNASNGGTNADSADVQVEDVEVSVEVLKWENPPPTMTDLWDAEVLLAADVIYDAAAAEAFAKLAARLLKGNAKVLYMSLEKRIYFSSATLKPEVQAYPQFLEDCAALGLHVEQIDLSEIPVHFDYVRSRFYELVMITLSAKPPLKRKCDSEEKPGTQAE